MMLILILILIFYVNQFYILMNIMQAAKIQQRIAEETKNIDIVERLKQIEIQEQEILRYTLHPQILCC